MNTLTMYTLLFTLVAVFAFCEAGCYVKEFHTNCSGLEECLRQQEEIEKLEMDYLSEVHNKSKYDKLCRHNVLRSNDCYKKMQHRCQTLQLNGAYQDVEDSLPKLCKEFGEKWKNKDAVAVLKNSDLNCKEVVHCVKHIVETENTYAAPISSLVDEKYYKNLCANSQKLRSCIAKKKGICENSNTEWWIDKHIDMYHLYCVNDGAAYLAELWHVIKHGCPRDKCYNDIRNIDIDKLEKIQSSKEYAAKKELCQKRETFIKCEEKYKRYCEPLASQDVVETGELLKELVCSKEEEQDRSMTEVCKELRSCNKWSDSIYRVLQGHYLSLFNETTYYEICNTKDIIYECYLKKQQKNKCTKASYMFDYERRSLIAKFVCSDEGKKGIELMRSSPLCMDDVKIPFLMEVFSELCDWWATGPNWPLPCPYQNRLGACLADKIQQNGCGPAYGSFNKKIDEIKKSFYKCKKDSELEAKDRFLSFPVNNFFSRSEKGLNDTSSR